MGRETGRVEETFVLGGREDLKRVLDHLDSGVVAHAPDTSIRVCNPRACEILGLTLDQMVGVSAPDPQWRFLREDGSVMPLEEYPVTLVLRTRQAFSNLLVGVNRPATSDLAWVQCNGYPVCDGHGELELIIITFIDVTELRRAEAERLAMEEQLRQATKMEAIGRLAGGIAHDFNNILTGVLGYAEMAAQTVSQDHEATGHLDEVLKGGERAADLTRQLLAFARKQVIEPRIIRPNEVIEDAEKLLRRLIGEDVDLSFHPQPGLWNVKADPTQLDQILVNLAVNARDAMPLGGHLTLETANVVLEGEKHAMGDEEVSGEFVQVSVSDSGEGMDSDTVQRIFEPFFSTKGPGRGTGLGLATVYGIVRQNRGLIGVYSERGHGTTFKLYFPAVKEEAETLTDLPAVVVGRRGDATILLVEDDTSVRELVRQILTSHGYSVIDAGNPEEALDQGRRFKGTIDLLLSDMVMPGMSGHELLGEIRMTRPTLPVLFMSGYSETVVTQQQDLDRGAQFLPKPFTRDGLLARVREVLG